MSVTVVVPGEFAGEPARYEVRGSSLPGRECRPPVVGFDARLAGAGGWYFARALRDALTGASCSRSQPAWVPAAARLAERAIGTPLSVGERLKVDGLRWGRGPVHEVSVLDVLPGGVSAAVTKGAGSRSGVTLIIGHPHMRHLVREAQA